MNHANLVKKTKHAQYNKKIIISKRLNKTNKSQRKSINQNINEKYIKKTYKKAVILKKENYIYI
jgi:hypothetical protein